MREPRCIICGEEKNGLEVRNDRFIGAIRWFKKNVTKNEKNYRLVVCKECFPKYKKSHDDFKNSQIKLVAIGAIFAVVLLLTAGPNLLGALLFGALIILFMYGISLLGNYMPELNMPKAKGG